MEAADVVGLETIAAGLEAEVPMPTGFILPGATPASGALDLARAVVRRAERRCLGLAGAPPEAMAYLNRMSLVLFILGRYEEHRAGAQTRPAKT